MLRSHRSSRSQLTLYRAGVSRHRKQTLEFELMSKSNVASNELINEIMITKDAVSLIEEVDVVMIVDRRLK